MVIKKLITQDMFMSITELGVTALEKALFKNGISIQPEIKKEAYDALKQVYEELGDE